MRILYVKLLNEGGTCFQRMEATMSLGYDVTHIDTK